MSTVREQSLYGSIRTSNNKKVLFIIEDTGNAYNLYRDFIIRNFLVADTDLLGVGGADSFQREVARRADYDVYIVIYDAGVDLKKIKKISNAIESLRAMNDKASIYTFTPCCFEEVLLSFGKIDRYINRKAKEYFIYEQLQQLMSGKIDYVDYFYDTDEIKSKEQRVEEILEILTKGTVLRYEHYNNALGKSLMSDCWLYDCCQIDITKPKNAHLTALKEQCTPMYLETESNKLALMSKYSLLGGLSNIINEAFEIKGAHMLAKMKHYSDLVGRIN